MKGALFLALAFTACGTPRPKPNPRPPSAELPAHPPAKTVDPFKAAARGAIVKRRRRPAAARLLPDDMVQMRRRFTLSVGDLPGHASSASENIQAVLDLCTSLPDQHLDPAKLACDELIEALEAPPGLSRDAQVELIAREVVLGYAWATRGAAAGVHWQQDQVWRTWMLERRRRRVSRPADWPTGPEEAQKAVLRETLARLESGAVADTIQWATPGGGQYLALQIAHRRYAQIIAAGGFAVMPSRVKSLRQRARSPLVAQLRDRLAQEGFTTTPKDPARFEHTLAVALADYQRAHGLRPAVRVGRKTLRALRRTARSKLALIQRGLDDWRRAPPRSSRFIQVNIPSFRGELWTQGRIKLRFPVIVGSSKRARVDGVLKRPNATPELVSQIESININPEWNIPRRILEEEILPKEPFYSGLDRAQWLEERGYEIVAGGTRAERVRQPASPRNPLGRVKFSLPNPHAIFLHDTPQKRYFRRSRRALSHGCIRVKRPLALAQALMRSTDWTRVKRWLRDGESASIVLEHPVPIYLDYHLVWVDPGGRVQFLEDLYRRRPRVRR